MRTIGIAFSCKSGTRRCLHLRGSSACCSHMSLEQVKQDIPQIQDDGNPLQQFPFRTAHYRNCYARTRLCRQMQKEIAREIKLPRDAPKQTETHAQPTERQRSKQGIRRLFGVSTLIYFFLNDSSMRTGIAWLHYNRTAPWVHTPVQQSCRMARQWAAHP